jgi:hypothetical protein
LFCEILAIFGSLWSSWLAFLMRTRRRGQLQMIFPLVVFGLWNALRRGDLPRVVALLP